MAEQRLMKDGLGVNAVERITHGLSAIINGFPANQFRQDAMNGLDALELKERVRYIIAVLQQYLPNDFDETSKLLMNLKSVWDYGDDNDPLRGFAAWPIIDYIGVHGLEHPKASLSALKHLTALFSAEFAIRPFIVRYPDITFAKLRKWCTDSDEHVRRLVSEGTRPRLPWGQQLSQFVSDPSPLLPLLELLKDDESEYVRRSVANSLNDISKDHPDLVIKTCRCWTKPKNKNRTKLIRHALRTLVKSGHPDVFGLLGYTETPQLSVQDMKVDSQNIKLGESANFTVLITATSSDIQNVVIDYAVHHVKANGQSSTKVFKLKSTTINPGETIQLKKSHPFKKITTRKYYTGQHSIELLINGMAVCSVEFQLLAL
ncbi:3-methyladenine DNA glycosylase AlkC [Mariprofundus ferrinatatus]|uniref:3-methyladenine DNA glycosylase AlkC n=1 Tax=Mariprofundus ferrinatatus TaxID=1921087 RepID=A0A2K8L0Z4_9PROT|nr:DNA alkylation repair protein [Mariprofundus ferrinatatus]ATX80968.1 3-methyladenine DNA glycosylase AlkC [Mariprofundus ferrinatatus]